MPNAKLYSNKDWRAMLEAVEGPDAAHDRRQKRMMELLRALMKDSTSSGIQLDERNITTAPACWNGAEVNLNASGQIRAEIVQEIIWELYEAKFRLEMFLIERKMVPEPTGSGEEWEMVQEIWYE